jgi:hypothetical protein
MDSALEDKIKISQKRTGQNINNKDSNIRMHEMNGIPTNTAIGAGSYFLE